VARVEAGEVVGDVVSDCAAARPAGVPELRQRLHDHLRAHPIQTIDRDAAARFNQCSLQRTEKGDGERIRWYRGKGSLPPCMSDGDGRRRVPAPPTKATRREPPFRLASASCCCCFFPLVFPPTTTTTTTTIWGLGKRGNWGSPDCVCATALG